MAAYPTPAMTVFPAEVAELAEVEDKRLSDRVVVPDRLKRPGEIEDNRDQWLRETIEEYMVNKGGAITGSKAEERIEHLIRTNTHLYSLVSLRWTQPGEPSGSTVVGEGTSHNTYYSTVLVKKLSNIFKLRKLCLDLSQLSCHHHNLLSIVQLLPDTIGKLSLLFRFMKDMKPSNLKQQLENECRTEDDQDDNHKEWHRDLD
ncbi:uncharacterized protein LOC142494728 [Ascaphus truei]|uniref:uncharacterized protein LOC142494728 n=1 Tax=Ascaphus truei TaxID=8439 RepID=UPI003F5AB7C5